jgi:hypothetical protein
MAYHEEDIGRDDFLIARARAHEKRPRKTMLAAFSSQH